MEFVTRRELEKHTLQKYDKNAVDIIDSAPLVAAYIFNKNLVKWQKLNCEGILFLYRKQYDPHFNLFLLNRMSNSHLYQPICPTIKLQIEDSYLFFKTDDGTIFGLWIYDKQVYDRISQEIKNIIYNVNLKSLCRMPYEHQHDQNSISRMLRHTEEEYLKSFYNLKMLGVDEEESTIKSSSVAKFFEDAGKVFKNTKTTTSFQFPRFSENTSDRIHKNVFYNPRYNVKCIEDSQRYFVTNDLYSD